MNPRWQHNNGYEENPPRNTDIRNLWECCVVCPIQEWFTLIKQNKNSNKKKQEIPLTLCRALSYLLLPRELQYVCTWMDGRDGKILVDMNMSYSEILIQARSHWTTLTSLTLGKDHYRQLTIFNVYQNTLICVALLLLVLLLKLNEAEISFDTRSFVECSNEAYEWVFGRWLTFSHKVDVTFITGTSTHVSFYRRHTINVRWFQILCTGLFQSKRKVREKEID